MDVRLSEKFNVMVLPYDKRLDVLIPHAKKHEHKGAMFSFVPHGTEETTVLANLGYKTPAPILSQYAWAGTTPFENQKVTAALCTTERRGYVLNGMGTGKTSATLYAADYLMSKKQVNKCLIVAPLSTLSTVWDAEIFKRIYHHDCVVVHGSREKRLELLKEDVSFYIINHDGLFSVREKLTQMVKDGVIDLIIIDELASFRNVRTRRWKTANALINKSVCARAWGLTGGPTPNAPTDAFGQLKLITPEKAPRYFKAFQNETMIQVSNFRWIPRKDANEIVYSYMQPSVRFARDDCFDLPDCMYTTREVDMDARQLLAYNHILKHLAMRWAEGEVTAANEGVKMSKLLQIGSGFVYTSDKGVIDLHAKNRFNELKSLINQAQGKVIVFVSFKHAVDEVFKHLHLQGYSARKVYGDTPVKERGKIFNAFENDKDPQVLVAHCGCMAHGLTLVAANTIIWYTPITSTELYMQANARISRPGQKLKQFIIHIVQSSVEKRVFNKLQNNEKVQGVLLDMFQEQTKQS